MVLNVLERYWKFEYGTEIFSTIQGRTITTLMVRHTHGALEDPIALPQRPHIALSNTLCKRQAAVFVLSLF